MTLFFRAAAPAFLALVLWASSSSAPALAGSQEATPPRTFQYGQITVTLDSADLIENRQQIVSAWTIANNGAQPRLAMIDRQRSQVILAGEPEKRRYRVEGLAHCSVNTGDSTPVCAGLAPARWTQIDPGQSIGFQVVTSRAKKPVEGGTASFTLRLLFKDGGNWEFKDVNAANVPLGGQAAK